ncbi:MAG: hypothetical protein OXH56_00295 [Gemmatimonadetes bacterium]|nr:hypothetical protein [Gemmatimonadota bacterium]
MIAPTSTTLERSVRRWVASGSELDRQLVIPGRSNGPSPEDAYATCLLVRARADGHAWARLNDTAPDEQDAFMSYTFSYSLQWFRGGSVDRAHAFRIWAGSALGVLEAEELGLTFIRAGDVRLMTEVDDDEWEERAGLDLAIGAVVVDSRGGLGAIDNIDIEIVPDTAGLMRRTIMPAGV